MKADAAYVHIGFPKCGSTSIQRFLAVNHESLRHEGWLYALAAGRPNSVNLGAMAMGEGRVDRVRARLGLSDADAQTAFRERFRAELVAEVAEGAPHSLVFSHETLSARLKAPEIERLRDFLAEFAERVAIVAYVRRQDELPMSLYSTAVLGGSGEPFAFPSREDAPHWFDYHRVLGAWSEVFGPSSLIVRRFGSSYFQDGDLLADFTAAIALPSGLERTARLNLGFDVERLEFVRLLNRATDGQTDPRWRAAAKKLHDRGRGPGLGASRRQRKRFAAEFEIGNRRVAAEFLGIDGDLFDHPFPNDGPGRGPWLSAVAAVKLALEMVEAVRKAEVKPPASS